MYILLISRLFCVFQQTLIKIVIMEGSKPKMMFFAGKGGVGKSTVSALASVAKNRAKKSTLLVSMDPAHNQGDIFEADIGEEPKKVMKNLWVKQIDTEQWIKQYLKNTEQAISRKYNYQKAFSFRNYFKVLQYSPGIEEYAIVQAFESILINHQDKEIIIFDMPPTALTLRFFSLPHSTLAWIEELIHLRQKIHKKQEIISKIKLGEKSVETDSILEKLNHMKENYQKLKHLFTTPKTEINLVIKPDKLSFSESIRIYNKLQEIDIKINNLIINGALNHEHIESFKKSIPANQYLPLPESAFPLIGMENLQAYLENAEKIFDRL